MTSDSAPRNQPAKTSMRGFHRDPQESSSQNRLDEDRELQRIFEHLWHCGPATTGFAIAAMLDRVGVSSTALDLLADWKTIDPATCAWGFSALPPPKRNRRNRHLRLVPPLEPEA